MKLIHPTKSATVSLVAWAVFAMLATRGLASDLSSDRVSIQVDGARVRHQMAGGIGASWHAIEGPIPVVENRSHGGSGWGGYPPANDDAGWRQIYHHADWLGLDFCRVEFEQRIYEPERNRFTWDSSEMRILYRILDWCERRQADVFLQQMWGNVDWNAFPEFQTAFDGGLRKRLGGAGQSPDPHQRLQVHQMDLHQQRARLRLVLVAVPAQ